MITTNKPRRIIAILLTILLVSVLCCQIAFAADAKIEFQLAITKAYSTLRKIATAAAVLGLVGCGIVMIKGNDQEGQKAKGAIKIILIALVCVWLLPLAIQFGKGMFGSKWDPHALGH